MVDRSGLFVAPVPGATPAGTSPTDGRLVLGALFGTTAGCIAGGVFTASATQMQISLAASVWRIPDPTNSAAAFLSPADAATFTFSAGPASGSRKDVLWVKQANYENGDTTSRLIYGVQAGVAASPGTEPAIAVAGAVKIGVLTVPAGASNAAACTFVPALPGTSTPPRLAIGSKTLLDTITGTFADQRATVAGVEYRWSGTKWMPWESQWVSYGDTSNYVNGASGANIASFRWESGDLLVRLRIVFGSSSPTLPSELAATAATLPSGVAIAQDNYGVFGTAYFTRTGTGTFPLRASLSAGAMVISPLSTSTFNGATQLKDGGPWPFPNPAQGDLLFAEIRLQVS